LNYFSYFSEIEDTFVRRRGKHLLLSPIDWALIESWKERGIPLHVALRGIEHAFDSHAAKKRKRSIKTLWYCQEEVEAQYAEWLESRVGAHAIEAAAETVESPFPRPLVLAHLTRLISELQNVPCSLDGTDRRLIDETLSRAVSLLNEIKTDYETATQPDARKLEESLTGIERMLDDAIRHAVTGNDLERASSEIESQVKPYKRHMDNAAFEQMRNHLLRKKLRERFGVPRLSLFFLHS
jgi:hypothetical protein